MKSPLGDLRIVGMENPRAFDQEALQVLAFAALTVLGSMGHLGKSFCDRIILRLFRSLCNMEVGD
jgi:hypothetical protein